MTVCEDCGDEVVPPTSVITAPGGWCAPADLAYEVPRPVLCSDCHSRMVMVMEVGIDPGRHGENLRVRRGGVRFPISDQEDR